MSHVHNSKKKKKGKVKGPYYKMSYTKRSFPNNVANNEHSKKKEGIKQLTERNTRIITHNSPISNCIRLVPGSVLMNSNCQGYDWLQKFQWHSSSGIYHTWNWNPSVRERSQPTGGWKEKHTSRDWKKPK